MAFISEISPDGGTSTYDLKDKNAQTKNLSSPISIGGKSKTTVESCLSALAEESSGTGAYVDDMTLYLPTDRASVSENGKLIIT